MSIRSEYRPYYAGEWRAYRLRMIDLRGAYCRICRRRVDRRLNLSHETHDPRSSCVRLLCAGCHARADAPHRLAVWRRRRAERVGQLWLLPELEWAPFPAWCIPDRVLVALAASAQGALFS
jgi:hypothetical protein